MVKPHADGALASESELRTARTTRLADGTSVSRLHDNWTKSQATVSLITGSPVSVHRFQRRPRIARMRSLPPCARRLDVSSPL